MAPSLTTAAAVPAPAAPVVHLNLQDGTLMPESPSESVKDVFTPVDEKHDIEISEDDRLTAYIDKDGAQVLVTWTRAEQRRVVRKADFLFLPIFTVSVRYNRALASSPNLLRLVLLNRRSSSGLVWIDLISPASSRHLS